MLKIMTTSQLADVEFQCLKTCVVDSGHETYFSTLVHVRLRSIKSII